MSEPFWSGPRNRNPCYECPDKYLCCSDYCQKPEFLEKQAERETIRRNRAAYNSMNNYVFRQSERNRRSRK
jgi:hypothetical protein